MSGPCAGHYFSFLEAEMGFDENKKYIISHVGTKVDPAQGESKMPKNDSTSL